ncbi:family 43 glycosylhydrolase [Burkholderia sp. RS01]|uniref:family 43 glycosylhydrolase n=1 Tax=unclassified Burkholderia TaxID=2613784 RepID=UPI0032181999
MLFAPDAIERNGSYNLYFCLSGGSEGVARSDRTEGPFGTAVRLPATGIDPAVFVDDHGAAYYDWGQIHAHGAPLNDDMMSLDVASQRSPLLTEEEHFFSEGSSMRRIGDTYYLAGIAAAFV